MFEFGKRTYIMGILNVTPDSFSDGGDYFNIEDAVSRAQEMVEQGADIIDIGAESTRPGAEKVSTEEEIRRLKPVIRAIKDKVDVPISIDTYKPEVAQAVLEMGVDIINDIWGLQWDGKMAKVVADYEVPVIIMYNGRDNQERTDIMEAMIDFLNKSIKLAKEAGVKDNNIILDPGLGFGTTQAENLEIMRNLVKLKGLGYPLLLGASRKRMIGRILDLPPKERVEGTVATTVMAIMQGIDIVRVHDVQENLRAAKVTDAIVR
ncbi:dihydropteroate synthase [Orenia metallireducens]|jgi:dihydropteroate synthase|uniref:Dihydropteroate synthase n=1 Tax=Orenia metallireducens TaxID=1413210 RepID=A0A285HA25_9FIRM|nr:dihydropteroate synthase [Orenia metallireducens]PRX28899.1 dihydropteroate synthase [Orenia metallireducens]SNY32423.1 dihydropteroate synthase [Orenia metallireducens]